MNDTATTPDRPPYDGNRSEDFALTDAPVYMEHGTGEDENCGPVLGLDLVVYPDPTLMVEDVDDDYPEPRDGVLDVIERTIHEQYATDIPEGYSVEVRLSGDGYMWDRRNKRMAVYVTVEMYGGLYRGDESMEDWCGRIVQNCRYWKIVDQMWTLYTGQRIIEDALRAHLGRPPMCVRCDGRGVAMLNWAPYEEPCDRCGATGDEPG